MSSRPSGDSVGIVPPSSPDPATFCRGVLVWVRTAPAEGVSAELTAAAELLEHMALPTDPVAFERQLIRIASHEALFIPEPDVAAACTVLDLWRAVQTGTLLRADG